MKFCMFRLTCSVLAKIFASVDSERDCLLKMSISVFLVCFALILILFTKLYFKITTAICRCETTIHGKVAIVTGANTGIGYEIAKNLAQRGAKVILACRNLDAAQAAAEEINRTVGGRLATPRLLDLSSLQSVRHFCAEVHRNERKVDILVNNAAVAYLDKSLTKDGLEVHFATNYFGPFLLTNILLGLMMKSKQGRIVNVSSLAHRWAQGLDLDNLNSEKKFEPKWIYAKTKLAGILFTNELAVRLKRAGYHGICVNAVHPGGVRTSIFRNASKPYALVVKVGEFFFKSAWEGAQPCIHLCISEEVEKLSGFYWSDCKIVSPSKDAKNTKLAEKLWERSAEIVKLGVNECYLNKG